jgi:hypothetical protein
MKKLAKIMVATFIALGLGATGVCEESHWTVDNTYTCSYSPSINTSGVTTNNNINCLEKNDIYFTRSRYEHSKMTGTLGLRVFAV